LAAKKRFYFVDGLSGLFVSKQRALPTKVGERILESPSLAVVSEEIRGAIQALKDADGGSKVLLVVDQLDLLLAAGGDQIGVVNVGEMLMGWREVCSRGEIHSMG
jgi:elongator complex protein 6